MVNDNLPPITDTETAEALERFANAIEEAVYARSHSMVSEKVEREHLNDLQALATITRRLSEVSAERDARDAVVEQMREAIEAVLPIFKGVPSFAERLSAKSMLLHALTAAESAVKKEGQHE